MVRRTLVTTCALLLAGGMGLSACGDNGGNGGKDTGGGGGNDTGMMQDTGSPDTGMADTGMGDTGMEDDTGGTGQGPGFVKEEFVVETEVNCENNPDMARCTTEPSDVDWGPASVTTSLELTSEEATTCCFDMTNDGREGISNGLGGILGGLGTLAGGGNFDKDILQSIVEGDLILLMEHQGLDSLTSSSEFAINFFLGMPNAESDKDFLVKKDSSCDWEKTMCAVEATAGKEFKIDPQSFDTKAFAQARLPNAKIDENGVLTAGPGKVGLQLSIPELGNLSLTINGAKIEGQVKSESELDGKGISLAGGDNITLDGSKLESAKLGGYVVGRDMIKLLNNLASQCDCAGNPDAAIKISEDAEAPDLCPDTEPGCAQTMMCQSSVTEEAGKAPKCSESGNSVCANLSTVCSSGVPLVAGSFDLDVDSDGQTDALSIGALIEATGAKIVGVGSGGTMTGSGSGGN